jgi:type IV pilus assembly protein PilC
MKSQKKSVVKRVSLPTKGASHRLGEQIKTVSARISAVMPQRVFAGVFVLLSRTISTPVVESTASLPLRREPVIVIESERPAARMPRLMFARMSTQEQILFTKRLSILVKAGVPILQALSMLRDQASSKGAASIMESLRHQVEQGQSLAGAMKQYKRIFSDFAINIVRVGEISGTLTQNLQYLADELKKNQELKRNIVSALVYPSFIVVATLGIAALLTTYVFPKILPIFASLKSTLPWTTRSLIAVSNFMQHDWAYLILGLVLLVVAWTLLLKIRFIRLWIDRNFLRMPLLGPMFKNYYISNFTRTLGLLLKSNVGIIEALQITGSTMGSFAYRKSFGRIGEGVVRGLGISEGMKTDKLLYPSVVTQMTQVGETTGHLSSSLLYLAEMYEDEMNNQTKNLSTSIEPVLMIVMGILVGFIAISIITPIYGITQSLHT